MTAYSDIQSLNWSSLKRMAESPLAYQWGQTHPRDDSQAMLLGRATHCAVLEPLKFDQRYIIRQRDVDGRTKAGKAWLSTVEPSGLEVLTNVDAATVWVCREAVMAHEAAAQLLALAYAREFPIEWVDPPTGVRCKGRLDALLGGLGHHGVVDLKTTSRGLGAFPHEAARLMYHGQMAWYLDGAIAAGELEPGARAYIIAVETTGPHDVAALEVAGAELDAGRALYRRLLDEWVSCRESGVWYGRHPVLSRLELPRWAPGFESEEEI